MLTVPGVAVLEVDEARAIGQELAGTGGAIRDRLVPLFVAGEYATSRAVPAAAPTVRLKIQVIQGDRRLETVSPRGLTEAEAVQLLAERLPQNLIATASAGTACRWIGSSNLPCYANGPTPAAELGLLPQAVGLAKRPCCCSRSVSSSGSAPDPRLPPVGARVSLGRSENLIRANGYTYQPGSPVEQRVQAKVSICSGMWARNVETVFASGQLSFFDADQLLNVRTPRMIGGSRNVGGSA